MTCVNRERGCGRLSSRLWKAVLLSRPALLPGFLVLSPAFVSSSAYARCDNPTPGTGETTTCDATAPNPETTPVLAQTGSTNVIVNILPGAQLRPPGTNNAVLVQGQSSINNAGSIVVTGDTFDGFSLNGDDNTGINTGVIQTSGTQSEAMFTTGSGNTMINAAGGSILIDGASNGILS